MKLQGHNAYVIDIEADNLYPFQKNTWTIVIKRLGCENILKINPFKLSRQETKKLIIDFVFREDKPIIIGHNYLGYDGWVLWKDFNIEIHLGKDTMDNKEVIYFDTLYASQYLLPDRENGHSLKSWGIRLGDNKIDYYNVALELGIIPKGSPKGAEFSVWSTQMDEYCIKDCSITEKVFSLLYTQLIEENTSQAFKLGQKTFFLMAAQSFTGFKFDKTNAIKLKKLIGEMIEQLKAEVEPDLPKRNLKSAEIALYSMPAKPFTKDGELSTHMKNFITKHEAVQLTEDVIEINGKRFLIEPKAMIIDKLPMNLEDQKELKEFFLSEGWIPSMWNVKKDSKGKSLRDEKRQLIKTTPKIQENGKICPNLSELQGELPKKIVKFMSLRNRLGVLNGWLKNPRLEWDGRLSASATGIASTHRQKHSLIVNVPKAQDDVLLGKEFRSLFIVDKDNDLIGVDQAALEARVEGHWTFKYDNGESAKELVEGDIHSKNAKAFFPKETEVFDINSNIFDKDSPEFKPFRGLSKNGKYAITYGCSANKLATTLRKPEKEGKKLFDIFWETNPALKKLKDAIENFWKNKGQSKWIPAIDGRRLYSRSQHSLTNLLFQSTGAIVVDYSLCLFDQIMGGLKIDTLGRPYYEFDNKIVKRVQYTHDEYGVETENSISYEVSKIMEWTMAEAGKRLNIKVPLVGEAKIGKNWAETH